MSYILTDIGEEYLLKTDFSTSVTLDVGLYNDGTDNIGDTDNLTDISTEPGNSNYSRQSVGFTASDISGNWGADSDSQISFDFADQTSSETIDSYFIVANFQSSDAGDGSANDNLIATGALSQDRDIGSIDTLNISAGGCGFTAN